MDPNTDGPAWQIPAKYFGPNDVVTPIRPAFYLAHVEDVSDGAFVRIWEVPTGALGTTTLTQEHLDGLSVVPGDTLQIYTWLEIPKADPDGFGEPVPRIKIELTPRDRANSYATDEEG